MLVCTQPLPPPPETRIEPYSTNGVAHHPLKRSVIRTPGTLLEASATFPATHLLPPDASHPAPRRDTHSPTRLYTAVPFSSPPDSCLSPKRSSLCLVLAMMPRLLPTALHWSTHTLTHSSTAPPTLLNAFAASSRNTRCTSEDRSSKHTRQRVAGPHSSAQVVMKCGVLGLVPSCGAACAGTKRAPGQHKTPRTLMVVCLRAAAHNGPAPQAPKTLSATPAPAFATEWRRGRFAPLSHIVGVAGACRRLSGLLHVLSANPHVPMVLTWSM